jgi:hypothetical protein
MAASAWKVFGLAKRSIGRGEFTLHTGIYRMALHTTAASAVLSQMRSVGSLVSAWASIGNQIVVQGGYQSSGRTIPAIKWSTGANNSTLKFYYTTTGIVFTASGATLSNVRYAVIRNSTGGDVGRPLCYAALSTSQFSVTSPNTLTVLPAANGVFTLV